MQPFWGQNVSYQKFGIAFLVINHLCTSIAYRMTSFTCIAPLCIGMCLERSFIHTETPFNSPLLFSPLLYTMAPNNKLTNTFKFQVRNLCPPPLYPSFAGCGNANVVSMSCKNILRPFFLHPVAFTGVLDLCTDHLGQVCGSVQHAFRLT